MMPMAPGVPDEGQHRDPAAGVVALVFEEAIAELRVRSDEEVKQKAGSRKEPQATAVAPQGRLDVRGGEAPALGEPAGDTRQQQQAEHGNDVDEPPAPHGDVGQPQRDDGHACAEGGGHGQEANGVGAGAGRQFFGGGHRQQDEQRIRAALRQHLAAGEPHQRRRHCAGQRQQTPGGCSPQDDRPPTASVGHGDDDERQHPAGPHDAAGDALGGVVGAELVGREGDRLVEERVDVAEEDGRRAEGAQHGRGPGVEPVRRQ